MKQNKHAVLLGRIVRAHEAMRQLCDALTVCGYEHKASEVSGACEKLRDWEAGVQAMIEDTEKREGGR